MIRRRQFLNFSPRPRPSASASHLLHASRSIMACRFEVTLPLGDRQGVHAANLALDEAERLEQQLTIFRETSDVSFINRNAVSQPVLVTAELFDLLLLCLTLYRETEGAFDITSGPLSRCWGFLRRQGRLPDNEEIDWAKSLVGSDKLHLDQESVSIRFAHPGVEINLGAIGKGYALDRLNARLSGRTRTALLSAGSSSLLAIGSGEDDDKGWIVGIRHPRHRDRRMAVLRLRDLAMATSGDEEQFFEHGGRRYGHILDPRSGFPAHGVAGVTVIAPSAAVADALATAFYVGGRELAEQYCSTHPHIGVLMLETASTTPIFFGNSTQCEVEIIHE